MTRLATHHLPAARLLAALDVGGLDPLPDADLLDRFARYAEHAAFDVLLRRHGPMVYGVCRRVLANAADADDAFQATFLVLVRKAGSLCRADRLGPWLYGVAFKVASKSRSRAARLAARQTEATDMIPDPTPNQPDWLPVLDAELAALPAKYREPLVLCELQGASRADAAKSLGIPEGTLSSRLARGRDLLRRRLLKHGTLLPAGGLAALFSAAGVGRGSVPASLLARTSELAAVVITGVAPAGSVPAGAARLTDEVMRGMMLTKLRLGVAAALASAMVAFGVAAALPGGPGNEREKPKATPGATAKPQPQKPGAKAGAIPDREEVQGLWVLDQFAATKGVGADNQREMKGLIGKMRFLVSGDVWWGMMDGPGGNIFPQIARLDPAKNPKWLDLREVASHGFSMNKCIYELVGDRLRLCVASTGDGPRPAEFNPDDDSEFMMLEFRRGQLPAAAGETGLVGSWVGMPTTVRDPDGREYTHTPRIEILHGHLFAFRADETTPTGSWFGGRYTLDTSKNPRWMDVELVAPFDSDKVTRLHGSYEMIDGRLKLVLGTAGKRAVRPLALEPAAGALYFNVKPTKEPLAVREKVARETAPMPRPEGRPAWDERIRQLMEARDYAAAEKTFRARLAESTGLLRATYQLWLGECLLEQARSATPGEAQKLLDEAWTVLGNAAGEAAGTAVENEKGAWVKAQAQIRGLQVLQQQRESDRLLSAATSLLDKHRDTVEELIILSLVYHAHQQKGDQDKARQTRNQLKARFDRLPLSAYSAKTGEFSRDYWVKEWFADK